MAIYFTSDLHLNHDKEFVWKSRGFNSVEEMNEAIITAINYQVTPEDDLYILGDLCMGSDLEKNRELLSQLNGKLHIVLGNHDTANRRSMYETLPSIVEIAYALPFKYGKYNFYLSHYPTITDNEPNKSLKQQVINLHGHTHQRFWWNDNYKLMYHVGVDSWPVTIVRHIDDILIDVKLNYNS